MTGLENYNRKAFIDKAKDIEKLGYKAVHTADMPDDLEYMDYIKTSISRLAKCDYIYLLPNWVQSNGVMKYELPIANMLGIRVIIGDLEKDLWNKN